MTSASMLCLALAGLLASSCRGDRTPEKHAKHAEHAERAVHGAAPGSSSSDLDRPTAALFTARCEHGLSSHECDQCRHQVGVVRVAPKALAGGLIRIVTVGKHRSSAAVMMTGEVRFDERRIAHLSPQVEGIIRAVRVSLGQQVTKGQSLLEIDSVDLGQAQGAYLEARATLKLAQRTHERQRQLRQEQITSDREFLGAQQRLEAASIRVRSAREKLLRLGASGPGLDALREDSLGQARGRLAVRAPLAGRVLQMHAVPGELAKPGRSLMLVGDLSNVWVWADLYESDLAAVTRAKARGTLQAQIGVKAFPDETFLGEVDLLGATMEESTRTVKVRINVANREGKLRPGMFATIRLLAAEAREAVVVPAAAVLQDEGRSFVFVHHQGEYYLRRPVRVGPRRGDDVEIAGGLVGGERIVGEGAFLLKSELLRAKMGAGCAD
jgi:membrane fusion protein, heavy metal efflux system